MGNNTGAVQNTCRVDFSFTPIQPVQYTVTATAGYGGSALPASQTVNRGATASIAVTAYIDYGINRSVYGTCPAGSWDGILYTTGAIQNDCTVSFSFTPPQQGCRIEEVLDDTPDKGVWLETLDAVRDRVLTSSSEGQFLIDAYYRHSHEVYERFRSEPRLGFQALGILRLVGPELNAAVAGRSTVLDQRKVAAIHDFAAALRRGASPELAQDLDRFVQMDLRHLTEPKSD